MYRSIQILVILNILLIISSEIEAQSSAWGVHIAGSYVSPLGELTNIYKPIVSYKVGVTQRRENTSVDLSFETMDFSEKSDKMFYQDLDLTFRIWGGTVEGAYYFSQGALNPYIKGGIGIYYWKYVRGEYTVLKESKEIEIDGLTREEFSWSFSGGVGMEYNVFKNFGLDVNLNYQIIVAELWPVLDLKMGNVVPFQFLKINFGCRYFF